MLNKHPSAERWNFEFGFQTPNPTSLQKDVCTNIAKKRFSASLTSPSSYIGSKITKVGLTLEFDPLFANDQQKSFIPSEQLLGCAVWLFGEELPLFSYNSDSSPLSLILIIIIFSRMMIMVMHIGWRAAFVPLQCQLLPCPDNYRSSTFNETQTTSNFNVSE